MQKFLKHKLTVLQVIAIMSVTFVLVSISSVYYFTPSGELVVPSIAKNDKDSSAAGEAKIDTSALAKLKAAVDSLASSPEMAHGGFGFCLANTDSGDIIYESNSNRTLVPASILKTITTGTALSILGPGYRFNTLLQQDGKTEGKVLKGNIYIRGGGDPTLGSEVFGNTRIENIVSKWVEVIRNLGIDSIQGSIIGDADLFENDLIPAGWAWEDMQSDYCAPVSGLSFHENTYDLELTCSGSSVNCRVRPEVPGLKLHNQMKVNRGVDKSYAYVMGAPYMNERVLLGEANGSFQERSSVPDPAFFCAYTLYRALQKNGIAVADSCTTTRRLKQAGKYEKKERKTIHTTSSPSLSDIVAHTNAVSQNFYAETLLKAISAYKTGYGSTSGGVSAVIDHWKTKGIDLRGFYMVDGSGVSRFNAITPGQLTNMLVYYSKDEKMFTSFFNSLPVAGYGSTEGICANTAAQDHVHFKSGYMTRVRCFAGYVQLKSGRTLAFTMMANNYMYGVQEMRNKLEHLMVLMATLD
jgi:D-alanyl-D-alanine carboxypeptidase/D-alanyl-D-alanine-endopeptidase (penicillin-binding protein 4)